MIPFRSTTLEILEVPVWMKYRPYHNNYMGMQRTIFLKQEKTIGNFSSIS